MIDPMPGGVSQRLPAGELGLGIHRMREKLARAGLIYSSEPLPEE